MIRREYITNSDEETKLLGKKLGQSLKGKFFLALYGNLGGGKTTFVQGLALGLGIKKRIISPTFIIIRKYEIKKDNFYHVDLYRIDDLKSLGSIGLEEIIDEENSIIAVEWAEKMADFLPKKRIDINFNYLGENKRRIIASSYE